MAKRIIASISPEETKMALLDNGELLEVSVERTEASHIVGNIYLGRVNNVLPGMQAAFVDIGRDKNAFLYIGDNAAVHGQPISTAALTAGQEIMVQIVKDASGSKGPRATTHLTLPGRYVVLMPTVSYIGISRRIGETAEKERLRHLAEELCPEGMGLILRTAAEGKGAEEIKKDVAYLTDVWHTMLLRAKRTHAPALIYRDVNLIIRVVRDYLTADIEEFVLDSKEAYSRVCDLLAISCPELVPSVRLHEGKDDVFARYGLDVELTKLGQRVVELACGGYIVIDKTEALTVIDVNTGKFVGNSSLSETVFRTNLEAAREIARQVRLRDIGGIIIIDFIDMTKEEHQRQVLDTLAEGLKQDKTKTNVLGITALGLVEMTRKKTRQSISEVLYVECPCCAGRGRVKSPETIGISISKELRRLSGRQAVSGKVIVQVSPKVAEALGRSGLLSKLSEEFKRPLIVEAVPGMHEEVFSILQHGV